PSGRWPRSNRRLRETATAAGPGETSKYHRAGMAGSGRRVRECTLECEAHEETASRGGAPRDKKRMKADFIDVSETRKNLKIEIPSDVVDAQIERVARDYSRKARIPGFRPGKAPARVIKQRFKEQILRDVANDLVPSALDDAMRERGVEPVDTPDVRD